MSLYLLNISFDTTDPHPTYLPENLNFNDQESLIEIIVEKVLGYENAIAEYDDHDTGDFGKKKVLKLELFFGEPTFKTCSSTFCWTYISKFPDFDPALFAGFIKIDSPPPKV